MADLEQRVEKLEDRVVTLDERMDRLEESNEKFFSKLFKRLDSIEGKMGKMMKWIYRCLAIIIVLLLIIAIKSPQTASQIISGTGAIVKAI